VHAQFFPASSIGKKAESSAFQPISDWKVRSLKLETAETGFIGRFSIVITDRGAKDTRYLNAKRIYQRRN